MNRRTQKAVFIFLGVSIGIALYGITSGWTKHVSQNPSTQKEKATLIPEVVSCVKNIRVVKAEIQNPQTEDATIVVQVENTSELGIIAISLESGKGGKGYAVLESTFEADEPIVIIEPHATRILTMEVNNIHPRAPLQIGSVMYVDGTEEGCDSSIKRMHETKTMHESQRAKRKEPPK